MGITLQALLHQRRETLPAFPHMRVAERNPYPHQEGQRKAFSTGATRIGGAMEKVLNRLPRGKSIVIARR